MSDPAQIVAEATRCMNETAGPASTIAFRNLLALYESTRQQRDELMAACIKTVDENGHLADGDDCTLIDLKRAIAKGGADV